MKVLVCSRCGRVNPFGARYCHFDGLALSDSDEAAPLDSGSLLFLAPLVFPSGRACRNFNELILAAEDCWEEAEELMRGGFLGAFLGGIGRADLAHLAGEARTASDPHHALDGLLAQLPSSARQPPKLHVLPSEINLGRISRGENRLVMLRLLNAGMGLLEGRITSVEAPWVMIGEPPGTPDKVFEFRRQLLLPIRVIGDRLRASAEPLEGKLLVTSGTETITVNVRAEFAAKEFPEGVLAGAVTPRQLAEKAKGAPKEAACLFESGAVKNWYEANGWDYPIQGPQASGIGAVQQFFEALGLTALPRVDISEMLVRLQGLPGMPLEYTIKVSAQENRAVFVHATSKVPWLTVKQVNCQGKTAKIVLHVPAVPRKPGQSLLGRLQVVANGGQRFTVAVMLKIEGAPGLFTGPVEDEEATLTLDDSLVIPLWPAVETIDEPAALSAKPQAVEAVEVEPARAEPPPPPPMQARRSLPYLHLAAPGAILLVLLFTLLHDALLPNRGKVPPPSALKLADPNPHLAIRIHDGPKQNKPDVMARPTMRFGLVLPREVDPADTGRLKRLTFDEWGRSNNTCLRIGGVEVLFGEPQGEWVERYKPRGKEPGSNREIDGFDAVWRFDALEVTQRVEIVPDRQSRCLDTCLVVYTLVNKDGPALTVGLRFLLDAFIGSADGSPYLLPGRPQLCDTMASCEGALVPDYLEALENADLARPGIAARLILRLGRRLEPPGRVLLGAWPSQELQRFGQLRARGAMTGWDVPLLPMRELQERTQALANQGMLKPEVAASVKPDSALILTWDEKPLAPGARREVGFAYGLGQVSKAAAGRVMLSMGGRFVSGGEITVCAVVDKPHRGETLTLKLPEGFVMLTGSKLEQPVPLAPPGAARPHGVATWRFKAGPAGTHELRLTGSAGATVIQPLIVYPARKESEPVAFD